MMPVPLDKLLRQTVKAGSLSCPEDRTLLVELVSGSVRWLRLLAFIIDQRLDRPAKIPLPVKSIMIVAAYQVMFLDRIPPFAAVNEAVQSVRNMGVSWAAGVVNAVLRQIARDMENQGRNSLISKAAENIADPCEKLAITTSHPSWIVKRWVASRDLEIAGLMCRADNVLPPLILRVNRLQVSRRHALETLLASDINAGCSVIAPDGILLPGFRGNPSGIPGFDKGWFQVQAESAQIISLLSACKPGHRILDACAGLGGKTTHLAEITKDAARIDAWDTNSERLRLLKENAARLKLDSIRILSSGSFEKIRERAAPVYDSILVDAPCSGLGIIGRHPDIKWNRKPEDIPRLADIQLEILQAVAPLLKPGGSMVFSVCTTEAEETVDVMEKFLADQPAWSIVPACRMLPWLDSGYFTPEGFFCITQQEGGRDGFFAALLRRNS